MNQKTKNMVVLFVLVALVGTGVFIYANYSAGEPPTIPPMKDGVSFSMFQALRVVYADGSDSWKYPSSRTALKPLAIFDRENQYKRVSSIQAYIFFNMVSDKAVYSVNFKSKSGTAVYTNSKTLYKTLGSMNIEQQVSTPELGKDVYVISATISEAQFQALFPVLTLTPGMPEVDYYYVISCSDIQASVAFSDGSSKVFMLTGVQATENQLWWGFRRFGSAGTEGAVVSVEWIWK